MPRRIFLSLGLLSAVLIATPAFAQVQAPADTTSRRDTTGIDGRGAQTLDPVRVSGATTRGYRAIATASATRTLTPVRDVPQALSVVTRQLIRDQAAVSMADAVRYVPGVTMGQGEGNRDQPTIRGIGSTSDFHVNGVRDDAQYFRDLYNADRVEVLRGSNAMVFGRGGGGGVLNRITKRADWSPVHEVVVQAGSFDHKRVSADVGQGLTPSVAARFNGMYENSGTYRDGVNLRRYGLNPAVTVGKFRSPMRVELEYEHFTDYRTADRGVPSFQGRPLETAVGTFFGDPDVSRSDARVHTASASIMRDAGTGRTIRNHTRFTDYDKFYQNVFPGAVNAAGDQVSISGYNNAMRRRNLFNQTDVSFALHQGAVRHTLLVGAELGRQRTDNFRNTGYFNDTRTSITAPVSNPTVSVPVTFRQSASDADNRVTNAIAAAYVQDQVALSHWQFIGGLRFEYFDIDYRDNRKDAKLSRADRMISPRIGVVFKPVEPVSFYASNSVSYLPSAGDQFSSLTDVTKALEPERFTNTEVGAKWDATDALAFAAALYRLDRTNTRAPHPTDPARSVQTGAQRTNGFELEASGNVTPAWQIFAAFTTQNSFIRRTTADAEAGAKVPLVPRNRLSIWNRYQVVPAVGLALGVVQRGDMHAAIDNKVVVPGYTEVDGAIFARLGGVARAQVNIENLLGTKYHLTAHNNNNISPGSPRAVRVSIATAF